MASSPLGPRPSGAAPRRAIAALHANESVRAEASPTRTPDGGRLTADARSCRDERDPSQSRQTVISLLRDMLDPYCILKRCCLLNHAIPKLPISVKTARVAVHRVRLGNGPCSRVLRIRRPRLGYEPRVIGWTATRLAHCWPLAGCPAVDHVLAIGWIYARSRASANWCQLCPLYLSGAPGP